MATPLALITLGAGFEGKKALAKIKPTLVGSLYQVSGAGSRVHTGSHPLWIYGRETDRHYGHVSGAGNAKLLYHGKEHEK